MIEEDEIKNEENEEFKIDLKFFDTKIDLKINSDFVSFISNICNIIKISEEDINSVNMFYLDADEDKINLSNKGDYEIFYSQVKDNTVKGIDLEIKQNSNLNADECLANFFNYIEQKKDEEYKNNIKKKNENLNNNNINNIKNEEPINIIYNPYEENENKIIQINENNENNNGEINFVENYFNNNEIFEYNCSSCNISPIKKVLYYCPDCDIYLCSNCYQKISSHPHIILKIESNEELLKTIYDIFGENVEEPNQNENKKKKKNFQSKILNFIPDFMKKLTEDKLHKINKKEKKIKNK